MTTEQAAQMITLLKYVSQIGEWLLYFVGVFVTVYVGRGRR